MKPDLDSLCIEIQVDTNRKARTKRERKLTRIYSVESTVSGVGD